MAREALMSKTKATTDGLRVSACGRAAAWRIVKRKFPRIPVPIAVKIMRDRRVRKSSRSSQTIRWKQDQHA